MAGFVIGMVVVLLIMQPNHENMEITYSKEQSKKPSIVASSCNGGLGNQVRTQ